MESPEIILGCVRPLDLDLRWDPPWMVPEDPLDHRFVAALDYFTDLWSGLAAGPRSRETPYQDREKDAHE